MKKSRLLTVFFRVCLALFVICTLSAAASLPVGLLVSFAAASVRHPYLLSFYAIVSFGIIATALVACVRNSRWFYGNWYWPRIIVLTMILCGCAMYYCVGGFDSTVQAGLAVLGVLAGSFIVAILTIARFDALVVNSRSVENLFRWLGAEY